MASDPKFAGFSGLPYRTSARAPGRLPGVPYDLHNAVRGSMHTGYLASALIALSTCFGVSSQAQTQRRPLDPPVAAQPATPEHRTRLMLKDGSYQVVVSYEIRGQVVRYRSAERNGQQEEIPLSLVDLPATQAWQRAHDAATAPYGASQSPPVLSPELAKEEAARAAQTPEVAKDLRLPEENSVLVLDTFRGIPELVPLPQSGSDLNHETAHAVLKKAINPAASPHDVLLIKGERADVQLHVADPVFFVRQEKGDGDLNTGGASFVVDTDGQSGRPTPGGGSAQSTYVLEQLDVRQGARAVASLRIQSLGSGKQQPGIVELHSESLPGGNWLKLTPSRPLEFGEYALIEILSDRAINSYVWDFGVHPTAKENAEALRPEPKRPVQLERRRNKPQE